jgi:hypothetical protein
MTIDTSTDALLDEAEAIVCAEWLRLQHDNALRELDLLGTCTELPAARTRASLAVVAVALDPRGGQQTGGSGQWSARRRPHGVWPTQRSPPNQKDHG